MTQEEYKQLEAILADNPFQVRPLLQKFVAEAHITEEPKEQRTGAQSRALHLWFRQIADICQNQGVTFDLIIKHTHQVAVTEYGVKALWHVLQKALYGTESTRDLKKTGQIDRMIDHFVALFAKEEVELPLFPQDAFNVRLTAVENAQKDNYPEHHKTAFDEEDTIS